MAAQPADRFPAIGEMVIALEGYLDESGIAHDKVAGELGRYFQAPAAYEQALKDRIIDHLTRRGQHQLTDDNRAAALDIFDRILTIDPQNAKVLELLDGISRRKRRRTHAIAAVFITVLGFCAWMIHKKSQPPVAEPPPVVADQLGASPVPPRNQQTARELVPEIPIDAAVAEVEPPPPQDDPPPRAPTPDAAIASKAVPTQIRVSPSKDAEYAVGTGPRKPVPDGGVIHLDLASETEVHVYSLSKCCQEDSKLVRPGADVTIVMPYLPGRVLPSCSENPAAEVRIAGVSANLGRTFAIPIGDSTDETKTVEVEFLGDRVDPTPVRVTVEAGKTRAVKCTAAR
jgi:hypothetical protein